MGKAKPSVQKDDTMKQSGIKNGSVKKNKNQKNTLTDKVALMNDSMAKIKTALKTPQKDAVAKSNQSSPKISPKQSKEKKGAPREKQSSPSKAISKKILEKEETDDSDSDIDEGILAQDVSMSDETFEDEEESDTELPDIFGKSLKDESDDDDEDFEVKDKSDSNTEKVEHKGVIIFKGMNSQKNGNKEKKNDVSMDSSSLTEDSTSEDDIELSDDDSIDDIRETMGFDEIYDLENESEDEDESESEDESEDESDSAPGLKALLGNSLMDEDDDEDFNEEDDEEDDDDDNDMSDENEDVNDDENNDTRVTKQTASKSKTSKADEAEKEMKKQLSPEEKEELDRRTIIIDNVPKETKKETIKKVFSQYGPINNLRIRGIIPESPKMSKKVAAIKNMIHPKVTTVKAYINYKSEESAKKALDMNGKMFEGNYLHMQIVAKSEQKEINSKKAVFLGNLKFDIDKNIIRKHFSECGDIESVYLIRDSKTGISKGSGYVNFKTEDAATLALELDGTEILNRPVRVKPCLTGKKHNENRGQKRDSGEFADDKLAKKFKNNSGKLVVDKSETAGKAKKQQHGSPKSHGETKQMFQGQKAGIKKKKSHNKMNKKRKEMAKKLVAK